MDGKPIRLLPRPPQPSGRIMAGAPPGFIQMPPIGTPPRAAEAMSPIRNNELVSPEEMIKRSPGTVMNCSDLEDMLLGRNSQQMNAVVSTMDKLPNKEVPFPPAPRLPFPQQNKLILPPQRMRPQFHPLGPFPVSTAPGLFSGIRVESRPKLPPPPGFEGPRFHPPNSPLQSHPGFSLEAVGSPQPWSPARQAIGSKNNDGILEQFKGLSVSGEKGIAPNTIVVSHRGQEDRNHYSMEREVSQEEREERALRKKLRRAAKVLERRQKKRIAKAAMEDQQTNNSDSTKNINSSPDSSKENMKLKDTDLKIEKTENESNENTANIKKKKKRKKDKVKKENENGEDRKSVASNKKEQAPKKCEQLKRGVFSGKVILSEDGEFILEQEVEENNLSLDEDAQPEGKEKHRKRKKKKDEKFEQYISLEEVEKGLADKTLYESELRINAKNYTEAYISHPDIEQDILILGLVDRNRSLEGDIVVVKLKDEADWHKSQNGSMFKTGKVVFVSERVHHGSTVGTLHFRKKGLYMLMPRDQRFPLLRIPSTSIPQHILPNLNNENKMSDVLYKGILLSWNTPKYANGIIQEVVGKKGDIESETSAIFLELGLNQNPIPETYNRHLPTLPYIITQEEIDSRLDLRSEVIFTIDPATARDLDDAVSIKKLSDDTFEVGVHISDVTHFLKEGTPLDIEVSERATTVYMVERAYHMLPIALCGLCSLLPGDDKLAISVIMKLDEEGNVLDKKFSRTIINSCAQLSYDHAQAVIEGNDVEFPKIYNDVPPSAIIESILLLNKIAICRRTRRFEGGALQIGQPKLWFNLNSDCLPKDMSIYEMKESHRLIEEFMLLANELVARHIHSGFPNIALLRRHDAPKGDMMAKLENSLQRLGIFLDSTSSGSLHTSLTKYCSGDEFRTSVLNYMCTKAMQRAVYFCSSEDTHHYALNLDKYTHFTSPIRRYADIVVHRILTTCLGYTTLPPWNKHDIRKFASTSNRKKYAAKKAGDMSTNLFRAMYIKQIGGVEVEGVIMGVNSRSIDVIIPSMAHNMRVYLEKLENIKFEFNENDIASSLMVEWPGNDELQVLQVFCPVKLTLTVSEKSPTTIEGRLLPPDS